MFVRRFAPDRCPPPSTFKFVPAPLPACLYAPSPLLLLCSCLAIYGKPSLYGLITVILRSYIQTNWSGVWLHIRQPKNGSSIDNCHDSCWPQQTNRRIPRVLLYVWLAPWPFDLWPALTISTIVPPDNVLWGVHMYITCPFLWTRSRGL